MATTNYSLPTLKPTALFDLVTDYNALSNATDAALASVAGHIPSETITEMQSQISALQTLTGSQRTQITTLQSQMSTANGNISTLQSGLKTANSNIGTLKTDLQRANQNISNTTNAISTIKSDFINYSTFTTKYYQGTNIHSGAISASTLYVMKNVGETIIKIFGYMNINGRQPRTTIPGTTFTDGTSAYGIKSKIKVINKTITSGYMIQCAALSSTTASTYDNYPTYAIGNDGYLYLAISSSKTDVDPDPTVFLQIPIYIDSPITVVNTNA